MDAETKAAFESLAKLIEYHGESLEQEVRGVEQDLRNLDQEMRAGFERVEAATARNTGMLSAGARAVATLQSWARQRDQQDRRRDMNLRDLAKRLGALERALKRRRT